MHQENIEKVVRLLLKSDREQIIQIVEELSKKMSYPDIFCYIFDPALKEFGELWTNSKHISLAQGYLASKIAEEILLKSTLTSDSNTSTKLKGPIIMGNIEDDFHSLGRNIVVNFLKANFFEVIDLGNDVLPQEFLEAASQANSRIIGVSAMMYSNAMNIKKLRDAINENQLENQLTLAVGGAVFNQRPSLVTEVGGNCTAVNALKAIELFDHLCTKIN